MKRVAFFLASMSAAVAAQASSISFEYGDPIVQLPTEIAQTGTLGLFDMTLGTLTGATLDLFGAAGSTMQVTNSAPLTQTARVSQSVDLLWGGSLGALNDPSLLGGADLSMLFDLGAQNYAAGATVNSGPLATSASAEYDLASILPFLQQTGGGGFDLSCQSVTGTSISGGGGNIGTANNTSAGCGASITYTYTAATDVSEPAPLGIAGAGLMALWYFGRRKA